MSEFENILANELISFDEVDWEEDRITLRVKSDGKYSATEEASEWGAVLASVTSVIVNKLLYKYGESPDSDLKELFKTMQARYIKEVKSEVSDLTQ